MSEQVPWYLLIVWTPRPPSSNMSQLKPVLDRPQAVKNSLGHALCYILLIERQVVPSGSPVQVEFTIVLRPRCGWIGAWHQDLRGRASFVLGPVHCQDGYPRKYQAHVLGAARDNEDGAIWQCGVRE